MVENSGIEWTHHTFNPWIGCTQVSPACDNCYAKSLVNGRMGGNFDDRRRTVPGNWHKPRIWNRKAAAAGERHRVFCASLADVFDNKVPIKWLTDLFDLIRQLEALDWLLLTKRPQNMLKRVREAYEDAIQRGMAAVSEWLLGWLAGFVPHNVWLGTTVEDQTEANRRIPYLVDMPAAVHFLSCEPLLGDVNLRRIELAGGITLDALTGFHSASQEFYGGWETVQEALDKLPRLPAPRAPVDWVIVGGESGANARKMPTDKGRALRDQCAQTFTPYFFKQMTKKAEIPTDLLVRQFPQSTPATMEIAGE